MAERSLAGTSRERARSLPVDSVALLIAAVCVLVGVFLANRDDTLDVDQKIFTDMIVGVQQGGDYYSVTDDVLAETYGVRMENYRAYRLPVLYWLLSLIDDSLWPLLAAAPAFAMSLGAVMLAGTDAWTQRVAAVLSGMWVLAALPGLYLYAELWAGPFLIFAGLMVRNKREGAAALLCLIGAAIRELVFAGLAVGILLAIVGRRDSFGAWVRASAVFVAGMLVHIRFVSSHLDPNGGVPTLGNGRMFDWIMISPGTSTFAVAVGPVLIALAFLGFWLRRDDPGFRYLALCVVPLIVATLLADRGYWSLIWCGVTSAAAAVAIVELCGVLRRRAPLGGP
jgi:hypothetical protein